MATGEADIRRTVIDPAGGWRWPDLRELWQARELLFFLAWRDIQVRYKQTALGAAWAVIQPAALMAVFTVCFGRLAGNTGGVAYPLFALAGMVPWLLFAAALTAAANSVLGSEKLITKVYFPRLAVPVSAVGAAAVDGVVACGLLAAVAVGYGANPGWNVLLVPVVFGLVLALAVGLGSALAALNVAYRDFRYVVPFLVQVGLFATPTIYMNVTPADGPGLNLLVAVNPMAGLVSAFRAGVVGGPVPWAALGTAAAFAAVAVAVGCGYFRTAEDRFADAI